MDDYIVMNTASEEEKFVYGLKESYDTRSLGDVWATLFIDTKEHVPDTTWCLFKCKESFYYKDQNVVVEKDDLIYWIWSDGTNGVADLYEVSEGRIQLRLYEYKP